MSTLLHLLVLFTHLWHFSKSKLNLKSDGVHLDAPAVLFTHLWHFSESKLNLKSDGVNLVAPASLIECLPCLPNVRAIQYKLGPERLSRLGNSNVLRLPVKYVLRIWNIWSNSVFENLNKNIYFLHLLENKHQYFKIQTPCKRKLCNNYKHFCEQMLK